MWQDTPTPRRFETAFGSTLSHFFFLCSMTSRSEQTTPAWPSSLPSLDALAQHVAAGTQVPDMSSSEADAVTESVLRWLRVSPARVQALTAVFPALPARLRARLGLRSLNLEGDMPVEIVEAVIDDSSRVLLDTSRDVGRAMTQLDGLMGDAGITRTPVRREAGVYHPSVSVGPRLTALEQGVQERLGRTASGEIVADAVGSHLKDRFLAHLAQHPVPFERGASILADLIADDPAGAQKVIERLTQEDAAAFPEAEPVVKTVVPTVTQARNLVGKTLSAAKRPATKRRMLEIMRRNTERVLAEARSTGRLDASTVTESLETVGVGVAAAAREARKRLGDKQPKRPRNGKRLM